MPDELMLEISRVSDVLRSEGSLTGSMERSWRSTSAILVEICELSLRSRALVERLSYGSRHTASEM
jgi:hypothetical protein